MARSPGNSRQRSFGGNRADGRNRPSRFAQAHGAISPCLAWTRAQRRARGQGARPHAKARTDRRRHSLQSAPAGRTEFQTGIGTGQVGAQPVPARRTLLIDALHSPTRQILHVLPPSGRRREVAPSGSKQQDAGDCCARDLWCQAKTIPDIGARLRSLWILMIFVRASTSPVMHKPHAEMNNRQREGM